MVGAEVEREGIIRAGAEMVESMATTTVPKIILTINHASGAGYYAMAGQGFDPNFTFSWPTARIGVMEGDSAVQALFSVEIEKYKTAGQPLPENLQKSIDQTRTDYDRWLTPMHADRPHRFRYRSPGFPRCAHSSPRIVHAEAAQPAARRGDSLLTPNTWHLTPQEPPQAATP